VDEAYVLMALGGLITREEHNALLEGCCRRSGAGRARQDRIRVVFEGGFCEQPPLDLIRSISQFCYVVDDDLLIGLRWIESDVPDDGGPAARAGRVVPGALVVQPGAARPAQAEGEDAAARIRGARARPRSSPPRRCASRGWTSRWRT
jgi:hypothetical protein